MKDNEKFKKQLSVVLIILFLLSRYELEELPMILLGLDTEEKQEEIKRDDDNKEYYVHDCDCGKVRKEDNEEEEENCSHRGKKNLPRE